MALCQLFKVSRRNYQHALFRQNCLLFDAAIGTFLVYGLLKLVHLIAEIEVGTEEMEHRSANVLIDILAVELLLYGLHHRTKRLGIENGRLIKAVKSSHKQDDGG